MYAVIICIFVVLYTTVVKSQCPSSLKVNITDGITGENYILHDGIVYVLGQYEIIDDAIWGCPCSVKPCIRKCCPDNEELTKDSQDRTQCVSSNYTLDVKVYDGTHPVKEQVDFFTIHGAQCSDDSTIVVSTKFYIQKNGYFFDDNAIYYPPDSYCLDYYNGVMIALICVKPLKTSYWALIIDINVILSTICFIVTAIMYRLILTDNIILKKCIISFSSSMCLVFISLIIMNVQANASACKIFGFSFLTLTVFSFFWLPISCIELFYLVLVPFENRQKECRWYYYIGVSSALSICILAVSLFSGQFGVPDIPDTFIRHPSSCKYDVGFNLITTKWIQKNDNQEEVRNTYYWIQNRNNYKFMCRTYMVIIFASLLWCAHLFYDKDSSQLPLDVLEAALGILTLAALVLNKYTRREISNLYRKKPTVAAHSIPLNSMATPATPDVESNPFFPNNHANNAGENNR
ncbi:hypothetical protein GWI33_005487 [Rhynchophorus ferrugineus]|uniref:Methuselah N-terminal domain-containing protein n=1 Tax=Rhynchophorus ferrugineus TaxID=354439 RepID=A0A834MJK0_RHYFE|nr:hypothetical protein GWI33_005487 [Rhynchophorus ferrugineus]